MINTQYINLNMIPSGVMPVLYCSQYDIGRPLGMVVYNGGEAVDLDTYTCTIEATRTDGTAITAAVTTDDNIGAFVTTATMTNQADKYPAKLVLFDSNSRRVASLAFVMCVAPKTMDENAESIEEDESLYQQYTGTVQTLIAEIREDIEALDTRIDHRTLNALDFGFVGDGVFDNSPVMALYSADPSVPIFFPEGVYKFSQPITLTDCFFTLDAQAEFVYTGTSIAYFFGVLPSSQIAERTGHRHFNGGIINAQNCDYGFVYRKIQGLHLSNVTIKNYTKGGLYTKYDDATTDTSGNLVVNGLTLIGLTTTTGDIGIIADKLSDAWIYNAEVVETQYAVKTRGGNQKYFGLHHWMTDINKYSGSATFYNDAAISGLTAIGCVFDTVRRAVKCGTFANVTLTGFNFFTNASVISSADSQTYPVIMFEFDSAAQYGAVLLSGDGQINGSGTYGKVFSDDFYAYIVSHDFEHTNLTLSGSSMTNITNWTRSTYNELSFKRYNDVLERIGSARIYSSTASANTFSFDISKGAHWSFGLVLFKGYIGLFTLYTSSFGELMEIAKNVEYSVSGAYSNGTLTFTLSGGNASNGMRVLFFD